MSNQEGKKPTPEQLEEMRQSQAQAQETFVNQNTALPMPQEGNKIPIEGGGYTWIDPQLANKPTQEAPEGRELTMDDMLTDQKTFEYFKEKGAFDSDQSWYEMLYEGGAMFVSDSYSWAKTLPLRFASNFFFLDKVKGSPYGPILKQIKAESQATTLQVIGDVGLNYEQLIEGASRLKDKMFMKSGSHEDNKSSYEFWKGINEIEKRRQTMAAELASSDFLMMGGDPEIRRMIQEGEAKPDFKASMGGSIWADPLNYISIGAGYKALRGGANTAFNGAETAMIKELQDAYVFQAQLKEVAKVNPSKKVSDTIDMMDGFIGENLDKLNKIAPKRDIALRQLAESLPQGHQLRDQIEEALTGISIKAKSNLTSKLVGGGMIATGKAVEITGSILNLVSRLPQETGINILMKAGIKEQTAMQIAQSSAVQLGLGGTATYGLVSTLTDDELLQISAVTAVIAPQLLRTYGKDFVKMGAELMQPETILPYWKRLASRGSETLTERTIDRSQWFPVRSVAEQITGAGQGKVGQRIASPFTKNPNNKLGIGLKNEPLGSTGSGGLYDLANALDKSKAGRYLELGGRMTDATVKGGAVGGVFGYIAGGGEQDEALYGGIGAGGLLGLGGGGIGGYGRFRGNLSPTELIQARYGNHQYYTKNLLPAMQKDKFNTLRKDVQIAVATTAMSYPNLHIDYYRGGKDGVGGEQGINKEGTPYIKVNVDSPRAIEPVIKHELSHYIEEIGGTTPFNDMLIGNPILGLKGFFTKLDENGDPIKKRDGSFETTQKFEDLKFDYFSKFDEYEALYTNQFGYVRPHYTQKHGVTKGRKKAHEFAKRKVLQKVNQLKDENTRAFIADQRTVGELVAEHGVDFFLNDQRRYRDLREGWVGALMRNIVDMPMVNNRQFLRTTLGKLGATFRADGTLTTPNSLFKETQRIPMVTELIRKYNRQMEGLSADQINKKFPVSEAKAIPVDISGADLAKNPELIELIRAGTFLKVDEDGVIRSNKAMSPAEIKKYNKQFADSILEEVNKIDADEGLPEGHIEATKNPKTGEKSFAGRFIDERVIDRLEQKGGWNKAQIDLLRQLNATLKGGEGKGTDWLMSYFKATKKGKYVNAKVENQVHIPYGIEITEKGNILIRTISQIQLDRNINKAFRQHKAEVTRLYGADLDKAMDSFHTDMHLWSRNHAEGKMGKDGLDPDPQIAGAKANFINSMFGKSSKAHVDANPWLEQLDGGKKSPTPTYRSLRLERIGKANQLTGKIHIDHNKIAKNLMPKPVDLDALLAQNPQMRSTDPNYMPEMSRRDMLKAMLGGTLASMVKGGDVIAPKSISKSTGKKFPIYGRDHLDEVIIELIAFEQNHYDDGTVDSPAHEDVSRLLEMFEGIRDSDDIPKFVDDISNSEALELMDVYDNVYDLSDHVDSDNWKPPHEDVYEKVTSDPQQPTMEQALESAEGGTVGDLVNNPFKGASDDVPNIIEDIDIATDIFGKTNQIGGFDRSWHINTLVKRVIGNADTSLIGRRLESAKRQNDATRLEFNQSKLNKADEYFYYMKYPLQDLVASLPEIKSQDIKKGLNSARNADPFEPIKDNFQGGTRRPLQDILAEMANVHEKFYPETKSTLNEIRAMGEILKDDYGAEIKPEFLDELYRKYRNLSKEEHAQFKAEEQKTLNELFNPEFNDVQDLGDGAKFIKPIDPNKNLIPKAPDTPEFRNWFKDSKVVDEKGEPRVVYHASMDAVKEFSSSVELYRDGKFKRFFKKDHTSEEWARLVDEGYEKGAGLQDEFWFSNKPLGYGDVITPVYLSIQDPKILENHAGGYGTYGDNINLLSDKDGVIIKKATGEDGLEYYIVTNPAQIKSSIANEGTFDPSNPDIRFMPSAERKPVTFSARPEEMVTLDSENIKNFMPAHKNVRLEDYLDYPIFCLPSDRMGVGRMFVGPEGQKIPIDFDAQGGRGFMYLYEDGGWAFSNSESSTRFLSRVEQIAGGRDHALVGITIMSDINHLNSVYGQLSLAQAYEAVIRSGHVSKEQMRDHLQDVMGRVAGQKYSKDVLSKDKKSIKHKAGSYKLSEDVRKALLSVEDPSTYKQAILDRKINFGVSPVIVEKFQQVGAKIKPDDQKKYNIDVQSVARDVADPELIGQPVGQVVALLKVPVNQKPKKVDFHLSYPWQVKGEAIGFLDQFKALEDLTSEKRVYRPDGTIRYGQPVQSVLPAFDKINPSVYMPNFKPMLDGKKDNIRADVLGGIKQDKFSPQQFKAKLNEVKGAKEMAEDIGLNAFLEGKKSVTKDEINSFIEQNKEKIQLDFIDKEFSMYEGSQMEDGMSENYREYLWRVDEDSHPHGDIGDGHWHDKHVLMHMRTTTRFLENKEPSFHIEELQSDWHQTARNTGGYKDQGQIDIIRQKKDDFAQITMEHDRVKRNFLEKPYKEMVTKVFTKEKRDLVNEAIDAIKDVDPDDDAIAIAEDDKFNFASLLNDKNPRPDHLRTIRGELNRVIWRLDDSDIGITYKRVDLIKALEGLQNEYIKESDPIQESMETGTHEIFTKRLALRREIKDLEDGGQAKQNPAPYINSWQHRAMIDAVGQGISQGNKYLTWTTGDRAAKIASLDRNFNFVNVRFTQEAFTKSDATNLYSVKAETKDGRIIRKSTDAEGLSEIIGKDYAKEAIDRLNKEMKEVEMTDIKVPHKGRRLLYDKIMPNVAKRIAKTLGVRPPTKAKIILQENAIVPKYGEKAGNKTQEVWLMELPDNIDKLHEVPLYMPSLMPQQNIPQANTNIMNRLQSGYFTMPKMRVGASKASQARDLEPENSYFRN